MTTLRERLPEQREVLYVFGGVVFFVYSWAIRGFLYQFSSLRLYHTVGEIFAVFSYLMAFALVESLVIMGALIGIGFLLPDKWLRQGFAYKGFAAVVVTGIAMVWLHYYLYSLNYTLPPMSVIYFAFGIAAAGLIVLIWVLEHIPQVKRFFLSIQERLQVFLYFYIPVGLLGLAVVLTRNLFQ